MPQDTFERRGGNAGFYYYDDYTTKASMSLEPIESLEPADWPTGQERLTSDTWDPELPALPNWDPSTAL